MQRGRPLTDVVVTAEDRAALEEVEGGFADLTEKQIRGGTHRSSRALEDAIRLDVKLNNQTPNHSSG